MYTVVYMLLVARRDVRTLAPQNESNSISQLLLSDNISKYDVFWLKILTDKPKFKNKLLVGSLGFET